MRLVAETAARCPDRLALRESDRTLTWSEVAEEVAERTRALTSAGATTGVFWACETGPTLSGILELLAILETGATLVPINPRLSSGERQRLLSLIRLAGWSRPEGVEMVRSPGHPVRGITPTSSGAAQPASSSSSSTPVSSSTPPHSPPDSAPDPLLGHALSESPAVLIWTSGTSGQPTGVLLGAAAIRANAAMAAERLGLSESDSWAATLSPAHVGGLMLILRATILGSAIDCMEGFGPVDFLARAASGIITHASLVPTMLSRVVGALGSDIAPPGLRAILVGGAHAPNDLIEAAHTVGLPVCTTYGMTEMCSQVATATPDETRRGGHAGRPLSGNEIRVSDVGEILVRGPSMALGRLRWANSDARSQGEADSEGGADSEGEAHAEGQAYSGDWITSGADLEPVAEDGWYHTGDLGQIDGDGFLRVTGRLGDRIISGGVNVDPRMVEVAIRTLPTVREVFVLGRPDTEWGERVHALVVENEGASAPTSRPELREALRPLLAGATLPHLVLSVPAIPLNTNGKVDRAVCAILIDQAVLGPGD